jgi:hypothetical protein
VLTPRERPRVDQVADPEQPDRRSARGDREMERAGVVRHDEIGARDEREEGGQGQREGGRRPLPGRFDDRLDEVRLVLGARDDDLTAEAPQLGDHLDEPLDRPAAPGVACSGVDHDRVARPHAGQLAVQCPPIGIRDLEARLDRDRLGSDESDDLEIPGDLPLVMLVRDPPIEMGRVRRPTAGRHPRAEPAHEPVRVAAAAVELDGEVEAVAREVAEQGFTIEARVLVRLVTDGTVRERNDAVDWALPTPEQVNVVLPPEERDLRAAVRGAERLERREGDDEVTEGVGAEDGDPVDVRDPLPAPRNRDQPSSRSGLSSRKKLLWRPSRRCCW